MSSLFFKLGNLFCFLMFLFAVYFAQAVLLLALIPSWVSVVATTLLFSLLGAACVNCVLGSVSEPTKHGVVPHRSIFFAFWCGITFVFKKTFSPTNGFVISGISMWQLGSLFFSFLQLSLSGLLLVGPAAWLAQTGLYILGVYCGMGLVASVLWSWVSDKVTSYDRIQNTFFSQFIQTIKGALRGVILNPLLFNAPRQKDILKRLRLYFEQICSRVFHMPDFETLQIQLQLPAQVLERLKKHATRLTEEHSTLAPSVIASANVSARAIHESVEKSFVIALSQRFRKDLSHAIQTKNHESVEESLKSVEQYFTHEIGEEKVSYPLSPLQTESAQKAILRIKTGDLGKFYRGEILQETPTVRSLLAMIWQVIHDTRFVRIEDRPEVLNRLGRTLYEIQRGLNINDQEEDDGETDCPLCCDGAFNKMIELLVGIHPKVQVNVSRKQEVLQKLQPVVLEEAARHMIRNQQTQALFEPNISSIWQQINTRVQERMDGEFVEFHQLSALLDVEVGQEVSFDALIFRKAKQYLTQCREVTKEQLRSILENPKVAPLWDNIYQSIFDLYSDPSSERGQSEFEAAFSKMACEKPIPASDLRDILINVIVIEYLESNPQAFEVIQQKKTIEPIWDKVETMVKNAFTQRGWDLVHLKEARQTPLFKTTQCPPAQEFLFGEHRMYQRDRSISPKNKGTERHRGCSVM